MTHRVVPYALTVVILVSIALAAITEQQSRSQLTLVTHELRVALDSLSTGFQIVAQRSAHTDSVASATDALVREHIAPRQAARLQSEKVLKAQVAQLSQKTAALEDALNMERAMRVAAERRKTR